VIIALKKYVPQITAKTIAKYIPIVGQATAVIASYCLSVYFGNKMIDDCETKAKTILEDFTNASV